MATKTQSETWRVLVLLTPAWLGVLWIVSKAQWFWNNRPDLQFGWIVLLLSAFLIWDRWDNRPPMRLSFTGLTAILTLAGLAVLFFFQLFQAAFGMVASALFLLTLGVLLIVAANLHYVMGVQGLRSYMFPFLFLLIALPIPSGIYNPLVSTLQSAITNLNVELLALLGIPAKRVGSLIELPNGTVGVDEACSGIRSLQSTLMATLFIGYLSLKRFSFRITLFVFGVAFAFLGNLIRSLYLSVTANSQGIQAVETVHDSAGWSVLGFTAAGVALIAWMLSKAERWLDMQERQTLVQSRQMMPASSEQAAPNG